MQDFYHSIAGPTEGFYKEKGSRFIARAWPVSSLEEVESLLEATRKEFYDARHVCYAYRLEPDGGHWRANDDGEPSHSAGDPILNEIKSKDLTNCLVAVVRYFGGTKLGVGGLIRAYGTAAQEALVASEVVEHLLTEDIEIRYAYGITSEINRIVHQHQLTAVHSEYGEDCLQVFRVRLSRVTQVRQSFINLGILGDDEQD